MDQDGNDHIGNGELHFARSARRHKIGRARARWVIANPFAIAEQIREDGRTIRIYLGDDHTGRPLEVGVGRVADGWLVVHVQDLRAKWRPRYETGKAAQEEETP